MVRKQIGARLADKRIFVQSSELRWIKFDSRRSVLTVEFIEGGVYEYLGVPRSNYQALVEADSKGRYFNASIRGHYSYVRIS